MDATFDLGELFLMIVLAALRPVGQDHLPADAMLAGMPSDCQFIGAYDLRNLGDRLDRVVELAGRQQWLTENPEVDDEMAELPGHIQQAREALTSQLGFDPMADLISTAGCVNIRMEDGRPSPSAIWVLNTQAELNPAVLGPLMDLEPIQLNGQTIYGESNPDITIGLTVIGHSLVLATEDLLTPIMASNALPAFVPSDPMSLDAMLQGGIEAGSTGVFAAQPPLELRAMAAGEVPESIAEWLRTTNRFAAFTSDDAMAFYVQNEDAAMHARLAMVMQGVGQLAQAGPQGFMGVMRLVFGVLSPDDDEVDRDFRPLARYRDQMFDFMTTLGADQIPTVSVNSNTADRDVTLRIDNAQGVRLGIEMLFYLGLMSYSRVEYYDPYPPEVYESSSPY
ncbi:MAG: hypothetical protein KC561_10585 [Myxococcales bacterium]|nr:hypothetical protein [Myxococcales bacterium]